MSDADDEAPRYLLKRVERTRGKRGSLSAVSIAPGFPPVEVEAARATILAELLRVFAPR